MKVFFLIFFLAFFSHAHAEDACANAFTTPEINNCEKQVFEATDKKLETAYQAALKYIDNKVEDTRQRADTKQVLVEAQRLWVQFRDKDCDALYTFWRDGTIRGWMYWTCMSARTESRIKELGSFGKDH